MGGNQIITKIARDKGGPEVITLEAAAAALGLNPITLREEKVVFIYDVGVEIFKLSLSSSFQPGSTPYCMQLVHSLFTDIVMPMLDAIPGADVVLCLDGCPNDLKELFKELRMEIDDYLRRKPGMLRAQAINCIIARKLRNTAAEILKEREELRKDDPSLPDLSGSTITALLGPLEADDVFAHQCHLHAGKKDGRLILCPNIIDNDNVAIGAFGLSTAFRVQQEKANLLFINNPTVNAAGKYDGLFVDPLAICKEQGVHPQLLPVLAAIAINDKSPGWPGIHNVKVWDVGRAATEFLKENEDIKEELEKGLTFERVQDLLTEMWNDVDGPLLTPNEPRERTFKRVDEIAKGAVDSVIGLPEFFRDGNNQDLLDRSQRGGSNSQENRRWQGCEL
jgi:hypothetical protein